ncbi:MULTISPECIES: hypothetical protein [Streptomyces]|uniref:hypothetical protein n=1 Tax=Streptomyces TaxID=1883 RepID=UPI000A001B43|nr:hypothetical protein [Streptomyces sp. MOE7]ARH90618.1 hypothetical protein STRMOE7_10190 [Streptomyces sp. MOE7]
MPESAARHEIRIRVTGTNNPQQDIDDLRAWLEREPWLNRREHSWEQRPRPAGTADGTDGAEPADMAVGVDDLILVLVGAVATELTKGLGIALREWLRRRKEERAEGEAPAVDVGAGGQVQAVGESPEPGSPAHGSGSTGED